MLNCHLSGNSPQGTAYVGNYTYLARGVTVQGQIHTGNKNIMDAGNRDVTIPSDRPAAIDPSLFVAKWLDVAADAPVSAVHHIGVSQAIGFASIQASSTRPVDDVDWMAPPSMWRWEPPRLARVARKHRVGCLCPCCPQVAS